MSDELERLRAFTLAVANGEIRHPIPAARATLGWPVVRHESDPTDPLLVDAGTQAITGPIQHVEADT